MERKTGSIYIAEAFISLNTPSLLMLLFYPEQITVTRFPDPVMRVLVICLTSLCAVFFDALPIIRAYFF